MGPVLWRYSFCSIRHDCFCFITCHNLTSISTIPPGSGFAEPFFPPIRSRYLYHGTPSASASCYMIATTGDAGVFYFGVGKHHVVE
jgi:hypothetical protein